MAIIRHKPIRSTFRPANLIPREVSIIDRATEHERVLVAVRDLEALKQKHEDAHAEFLASATAEHKAAMEAVDKKLAEANKELARAQTIQKGKQGEPGPLSDPLPVPTKEEIVKAVLPLIPPPEKGDPGDAAPPVDIKKVVKMITKALPPVKEPVVDYQKIVEMVFEGIVKDKRLKLEHIGDFKDGLEQTLRPIRSLAAGFRGGGDTVAAGSNVSITTVNGVKTISSSGGSGFTELAATETPDGAITVFTFALASAQPSYIVVDNVWMKATSKAGTTNWTWNAGAKQATLAVPAQDDIFAIV